MSKVIREKNSNNKAQTTTLGGGGMTSEPEASSGSTMNETIPVGDTSVQDAATQLGISQVVGSAIDDSGTSLSERVIIENGMLKVSRVSREDVTQAVKRVLEQHGSAKELVKSVKKIRELGLTESEFVQMAADVDETVAAGIYTPNPWSAIPLDLQRLLQSLPPLRHVASSVLEARLNNIIAGRDITGVPLYTRRVVDLPGDKSIEARLATYLAGLQMLTGKLPLGDISSLPLANQEKVRGYAAMIANRVASIAELDFITTDAMADFVISEGADENVNLSDRNSLIARLNDMTETAKRRYISSQVIQPLMRSALIERGRINDISLDNLRQAAVIQNRWLKTLKHRHYKQLLVPEILTYVANAKWAQDYYFLSAMCMDGVTHRLSYVMSSVVDVVNDDRRQQGLDELSVGYAVVDDDDMMTHSTPTSDCNTTVTFRNIHGDIIGLKEDVRMQNVQWLTLFKSRNNVAALIRLAADFSHVDIINELSLSFITQRVEWQGILDNSMVLNSTLSSDSIAHDNAVYSLVDAIAKEYFCADIMNGAFPANPVLSIFDEANRESLEATYLGTLDVLAVARKAYDRAIKELLYIVSTSPQWKNDPIWDELKSINIVGAEPAQELFSSQYVRKYENKNSVMFRDKDAYTAVDYYLDETLDSSGYFTPISQLRNILRLAGASSVMETHWRLTRPLRTLAPHTVDAVAVAKELQWYHMDLISNIRAFSLSQIDVTSLQFRRGFTATALNSDDRAGAEIADTMIMLGDMSPIIETELSDLQGIEKFPIALLGHTIDVNDPLFQNLTAGRDESSYDRWKAYALIDPAPFVEVKEVDRLTIDANVRIALPIDQRQLADQIKSMSFSMKVSDPKTEGKAISQPLSGSSDGGKEVE